MADIVVFVAHPHMEHSRVHRALMQAAAGADPARVAVRDLYALYPDYLIDAAAEQAALAEARLIVWQLPMRWFGMPALMKLWLDEVFSPGWAYGPEGRRLHGKDLWLVASTGDPFDALLAPFERTAALAGMRWLPPLLLHAAQRLEASTLREHAALYAQRLASYPDWPDR